MAAPAFGSVGTHLFGSSATASFAVPASVASGDIIVIPIFIDVASVTITAMASGFAHAEGSPVVGGSNSLAVVWKRASGADTGTYDFTLSSSTYRAGSALRYTGCVAAGNPWDSPTNSAFVDTNGTVTPSVNVDTAGPDRMLVFCATNWSGGAWTPPTGFTERFDTGDEVNTADDLVQATQGNSGGVTATCAGNDKRIAWLGALIGTTASGSIPPPAPRTVAVRDPGETWWIQRDRRDANTVGSAANPLASPLDSAWQAGGLYWHLYNDASDAAARTWMAQQRTYSDPSLLAPTGSAPPAAPQRTVQARDPGETWWQQPARRDPMLLTTALLENELLGSADDLRRRQLEAAYYDRREVPQQRLYVSDPLLLTTAQLENELLGSADDLRRRQVEAVYFPDRREVPQQRAYVSDPSFYPVPNPPDITTSAWLPGWLARNVAGTHVDRREVPQQRPYISDPSFYPTVAPTDPLTVAWGAGGHYWLLYNQPALDVDRREVPQQRAYISDPLLLTTALLEAPLLGAGDRHAMWFTDRREVPQQRAYVSDPSLLTTALLEDALLGIGDGRHSMWFTDRRLVPQQRQRVSDPTLLTTALLEGPLLGSGDTARHGNWFPDRREIPAQRLNLALPPAPPVPADPLMLSGDRLLRILLAATHASRWSAVWQPPRWNVASDCKVHRPFTGTFTYASGGTVTRPNTGTVEYCTCCT